VPPPCASVSSVAVSGGMQANQPGWTLVDNAVAFQHVLVPAMSGHFPKVGKSIVGVVKRCAQLRRQREVGTSQQRADVLQSAAGDDSEEVDIALQSAFVIEAIGRAIADAGTIKRVLDEYLSCINLLAARFMVGEHLICEGMGTKHLVRKTVSPDLKLREIEILPKVLRVTAEQLPDDEEDRWDATVLCSLVCSPNWPQRA
jgi:hypothetical protein